MRKGLMQGNPLSLLLFILVVDILDHMLTTIMGKNMITSIGSKNIMGNIHCIQFVDDMLILCNARRDQAANFRFIVYSFEMLSGLKINFDNSTLTWIDLDMGTLKKYANLMGCIEANFPIKYLGYLLHYIKTKVADWHFFEEKLRKNYQHD